MALLFDLGTGLSDLRGVSCWLFNEIRLTVRVGCSAGGVRGCSIRSTGVSNSITVIGVSIESIISVVTKSVITSFAIGWGVVSISSGTISIYFLLTTIGS